MFTINWKFLVYFLVFLNIGIKNVKNEREEIFTAVSDMESMISAESTLIKYFQDYLNDAELKLSTLKRVLTEHKDEFMGLSQKLNQSNEMIQSMALYKFISKFNKKYYHLEDIIEYDPENALRSNIKNQRSQTTFPTKDDLTGVISGLARLQDVYGLTVESFTKLSNSNVKSDIDNSTKLDFTDYYLIGLYLFNGERYDESEPWIKKALENYGEHSNDKLYEYLTKFYLYELLAWINYKKKNFDLAIQYCEEYLKIKPNVIHVEKNLHQFKVEKELFDAAYRKEFVLDVYKRYKLGCRNELKRSIKLISNLQCWYLTETSYFLQYSPIKIEEINFSPEMFLFHDVIYDSEIKILQNLVKGKLTRAKVWDANKNSEYKADYRTNKLAWLKNEIDPTVGQVRQRIADITGLAMSSSEELQIANYGIGGHYEPHLDFHYDETGNSITNFPGSEWGNRMATLIFYLSDVKSGGATVFPLLNITVYPQKGSALFWYNLFSTGTGDMRTYHAACPVLEGDKWILNEWIHERDQEFNRPCTLKRDDM